MVCGQASTALHSRMRPASTPPTPSAPGEGLVVCEVPVQHVHLHHGHGVQVGLRQRGWWAMSTTRRAGVVGGDGHNTAGAVGGDEHKTAQTTGGELARGV